MRDNIAPVSRELAPDETYGAAMTTKGLQLIARIAAKQANLTLAKVLIGSGTPPEGACIGDLENLVEPVAEGTVSEPVYKGDTVEMTVEYRSDMNGGLREGFLIREFGIFAKDPDADGGEVMIFYGNLSKYPQYIAPYAGGGLDIRRYPVSVTVAEGTTVILDGLPGVVTSLDDVRDYCMTILLPQFLVEVQPLIDAHNRDEYAHLNIRDKIGELETGLREDIKAAKQTADAALETANGAAAAAGSAQTAADEAKDLARKAGETASEALKAANTAPKAGLYIQGLVRHGRRTSHRRDPGDRRLHPYSKVGRM